MGYTIFDLRFLIASGCFKQPADPRKGISLNGLWEIARTDSISEIPCVLGSKIPVTGLVGFAVPGLDNDRSF